ncbi:hypothetical protein CN602_06715 [Bacillus cereus]|nr:hypothetical protein CN602_06715 [Bacillus cereus]
MYINDFSNISIVTCNISTVFRIYLSQLAIYQRFFKYIYHNLQYINDSIKEIDLITKIYNNITPCHTRKLLKQIG